MTTLVNDILVRASRQQVWDVLSTLDLLSAYDPGTKASALTGEQGAGVGAQRRCEVTGGWLIERVVAWDPPQTLAFELTSCSFPITALRHDYTLLESNEATVISQIMTYELKYGAVGRAVDAVVMRRRWDQGIKAFLVGLKDHVEAT